MTHARRFEEGIEGLPIDLFLQSPEDARPRIEDGRAGWNKRHTLPSTGAFSVWTTADERKEATARLSAGGAAGVAVSLLRLLYQNRAR